MHQSKSLHRINVSLFKLNVSVCKNLKSIYQVPWERGFLDPVNSLNLNQYTMDG
jgi:hypothetical protein